MKNLTDNGTLLTLGLVGVVAAAGAIKNRGSMAYTGSMSEKGGVAYVLLVSGGNRPSAKGLPKVWGAARNKHALERDARELYGVDWKIQEVEIVPSGYTPTLHMTLDHQSGRSFGPDPSFVVYDHGRVYGFFRTKKHAQEWIDAQKSSGKSGMHPIRVSADAVEEVSFY